MTRVDVNAAADLEPVCRQGQTFSLPITWQTDAGDPIDLTGRTVHAQVRARPGATTVLLTLTATITNAPAGEFVLTATAATMAAVPPGEHVWDCEARADDAVPPTSETIAAGAFIVLPQVTRP